MKRVIAVLIGLLLVFTLVSCTGGSSDVSTAAQGAGTSSSAAAGTESASPSQSAAQEASTSGAGEKNPGDSQAENAGFEQSAAKVAVSSQSYPLKVRDYFGYITELDVKPERIAVLSGTPLNIWYDLGGTSICSSNIGDNIRLVDERREEMLALPTVGPVYSLDMEAVVAQNPSLILTQAGVQSKSTDALRNMNYPVIATLVRSYEDLCDHYRVFGVLLGVPEKAEEKIASFEKTRAEIMDKLPAEGKTVAILYLTSGALSVKLDNSIAGDMVKTLGLRNIASDLPPDTIGSENTPLDIEYLVAQNPDLILVTSMIGSNEIAVETMEKHFSENQAWQTVEAVRENRVHYLPQEYFLYHSGPYYADALMYLAKAVYPEIYGEIQE